MGKIRARWSAFLEREKEKTKDMTTKKKVEYVVGNYKVEFFGVVIAILLLVGIGYAIDSATNRQLLYVAAVDSYANIAQNDELIGEFKQYIGNTNRKDKIVIDTSLSVVGIIEDKTGEYYEYREKCLLMAGTGLVDVYICEAPYVDFLEDHENVQSVRETLGEELADRYADSIEDDRMILLPPGAAAHFGVEYEPSYLVFTPCNHSPETTIAFARFLMEQGWGT